LPSSISRAIYRGYLIAKSAPDDFGRILAIGIVYSLLIAPQYSSSSSIKIAEDNLYYNEKLYEYFPQEADDLWIIPEKNLDKQIDYMVSKFESAPYEMTSEEVLNAVLKYYTGESIDIDDLGRSINVSINRKYAIVTVTAYADSPDAAYKINESILDEYIESKRETLEESYENIMARIDFRITEIDSDLESLSEEAEESILSFFKEHQERFEGLDLYSTGISFVDPVLSKEIDEKYEEYVFLVNTRKVLDGNKDFFIERIEILESPEPGDVQDNSNYFRNILMSIVAAVVFGIAAAFIVNYFKS